MDAKHAVLRPAQRAGPGRHGSARKPWFRGDARPAALIFSVTSAPLWTSVPDQFLNAAATYCFASMRVSSRTFLARATLARMSLAEAVQMNGFGAALWFVM